MQELLLLLVGRDDTPVVALQATIAHQQSKQNGMQERDVHMPTYRDRHRDRLSSGQFPPALG